MIKLTHIQHHPPNEKFENGQDYVGHSYVSKYKTAKPT